MTITTPEQMREAAIVRIDALINAANKAGLDDRKEGLRDAHHAIRAIPIAPQPTTDWTACAADMLRVWDTWVSGSSDSDRDSAQRLATAASFAEQAFDHAHNNINNIIAARAPAAMFRAFLLALIDPLHPDLDYLRADQAAGEKARTDRGVVAPPVAAAPQPVAVTVKPLVYIASKAKYGNEWVAKRDAGYPLISSWIDQCGVGETSDWPSLWEACISEASSACALVLICRNEDTLKGAWAEMGAALAVGRPVFAVGIDAFSIRHHPNVHICESEEEAFTRAYAETFNTRIKPADPLSDPRVVALVEALRNCPPTSNPTESAEWHLERINAWWRLTARPALSAIGGEA